MIRHLAALGAACALACAPLPALAGTVGPSTLANGATSPLLAVTANSPVSITLPGGAPVDSSGTGATFGRECFTVMRSQDGTAAGLAPLTRDSTGALAHYCGPTSIDLTEARSGTSYAIEADPGTAPFVYRIDQ